MSFSGNKGEWSELYVFLKLLSEGKLYAGNSDLEKIENLFYPVLSIIKIIKDQEYRYNRNSNIILKINDQEVEIIPIEKFTRLATIVLDGIKEGSGSFQINEAETLLREIKVSTVKAKSTSKRDITVVVHDNHTNRNQTLGFSIKSMMGSASTLLNPSKSTNFKYKITGDLTPELMNDINSIDSRNNKVQKRIKELVGNGLELEFVDIANDIFRNNLIMIDSMLPAICNQILLFFYRDNISHIKDIIERLINTNPLGYDLSTNHSFYEYKLKKMLVEIALGMTPAKQWNGIYDATGGYIVVKEDGQIICYHIYNRNEFEEYLCKNTKLDTPSTTKFDFARVYRENSQYFIKLNLQIRFLH